MAFNKKFVEDECASSSPYNLIYTRGKNRYGHKHLLGLHLYSRYCRRHIILYGGVLDGYTFIKGLYLGYRRDKVDLLSWWCKYFLVKIDFESMEWLVHHTNYSFAIILLVISGVSICFRKNLRSRFVLEHCQPFVKQQLFSGKHRHNKDL